jgi:single-stranded DNA-specific DHH superfamily exonuclease
VTALPDFQEYIEQQQPKRLVLLHHWDTDGLACAALFLDYVERVSPQTEVVLRNPSINNYFLTEAEFAELAGRKADALLTTDINFPLEVIERLEQVVPQVFVFDHHVQTANINRPGLQSVEYPGCTMLVNDYLMNPLSLTAVLGMVGDQEDRIRENPRFYPAVEQMLTEHNLTFDQLQRITKLIDTTYMAGDRPGLHYAIELIRRGAEQALSDPHLRELEQAVAAEMARETAKPADEIRPGVRYLSIASRMSLISEVTRAKAKTHPDQVILTDQVWGEQASLYARRRNAPIDLSIVVEAARSRGFNAGGKPEVAGVVLPANELPRFREAVADLIATNLPQP